MSLVDRVGHALRSAARRPETFLGRVSQRFALPQLYERYRKNALTHGAEFLRGEDEVVFWGERSAAPINWRAIPSEGAQSLSRATLRVTDEGTVMLRGSYAGVNSELQLIPGAVVQAADVRALGPGAVGMASTDHWALDLEQHHWLELRMRSDRRAYELVALYEGQLDASTRVFRMPIPPDTRPAAVQGATDRGAYGLLDIPNDASAEEIREAFKAKAKELHPDIGGD